MSEHEMRQRAFSYMGRDLITLEDAVRRLVGYVRAVDRTGTITQHWSERRAIADIVPVEDAE